MSLQFDSLVQSASGINSSESDSYNAFVKSSGGLEEKEISQAPRVLPCQALDHASGYLLAFGILAAKCRTLLDSSSDENGWHVQVSLVGVAAWLGSLGRLHGAQAWQDPDEINDNGKEVQELLEPYAIRGAKEPLTLYSLRHSASPISSHEKNVPYRLDVDPPKWT